MFVRVVLEATNRSGRTKPQEQITGSGKSVLLALIALQFRRYLASQVFAFDFGGSIRAATLAMGGDWHDLGGELTAGAESSVALQPLVGIHETPERAWAADWLVAILTREGVEITPEVKEYIWTALTSLASAPVAGASSDIALILVGCTKGWQRRVEAFSSPVAALVITRRSWCLYRPISIWWRAPAVGPGFLRFGAIALEGRRRGAQSVRRVRR